MKFYENISRKFCGFSKEKRQLIDTQMLINFLKKAFQAFIVETTFNREKLISSNDTTATVASLSRAFCKQEKRFNFRIELFIEF